MSKISPYRNDAGDVVGYIFDCPGCKSWHLVHTAERNSLGAVWGFNGDMERPTFTPSLNQRVGPFPQGAKRNGQDWSGKIDVCHLFVRDGMCQFLDDCTHESAGQTLPLPDRKPYG